MPQRLVYPLFERYGYKRNKILRFKERVTTISIKYASPFITTYKRDVRITFSEKVASLGKMMCNKILSC